MRDPRSTSPQIGGSGGFNSELTGTEPRIKRAGRIPLLIVCPHCQPGPWGYAGKIIPVVCKECREAIAAASR